MGVPSTITDLSVAEASNSPAGTDTATITTMPDDYLRPHAAIIRRMRAQGANIASGDAVAGVLTIGTTTDGEYVHITGTTTLSGFDTIAAGVQRKIVFDGALQLTHNATSFILPGGANITTAAGDTSEWISEGSGNWRCFSYVKASGAPIGSYQPLDSDLTAIAALTTTATGRSLLAIADAAAGRTILGSARLTSALTGTSPATGDYIHGTDTSAANAEVKFLVSDLLALYASPVKAWVNFNASGVIQRSYNVSSVTKNATGNFTVNFASSITANYAVVGTARGQLDTDNNSTIVGCGATSSTSSVDIFVKNAANALVDSSVINVIITG